MRTSQRIAVLLATAAIVLAACSSGGGTSAPSAAAASEAAPSAGAASEAPASAASGGEPVTIDWWHIQNNDPGKALWQTMADEYTAAHPNVKINITVLENEAFKTKLTTDLQAGNVPDLFQSWGGGGLREQVEAGLVKDITADVADWTDTINAGALGMYQVDGKQYGIPFDLGMVGFWYNKDLFAKAGITAPPATWDELLADVGKLKAAGITPIAARRQGRPGPGCSGGPTSRSASAARTGLMQGDQRPATGPIRASSRPAEVKELVDCKPFQEGFLAAPWDGAGGRGRHGHGGRGRRDAAHGPVGARHDAGELPLTRRASATTSAGSRSRRRRRRRRRRPTGSAAATASPSARTPRRRPSTS